MHLDNLGLAVIGCRRTARGLSASALADAAQRRALEAMRALEAATKSGQVAALLA